MIDKLGGMWGLLIGLAGGGLGLYLGLYLVRRKHGLDERFAMIQTRAQAAAWRFTLAAIILLFFWVMLRGGLSVGAVLSILYVVHMAGWGLAVVYYNLRY